ncbi:flavin reductase family protein [Streptomyces cavernae]|uniref:flavin reductase family protein n=1 Tax=Streptomyces cavernae TaxID=2259034 RepID=UPI000FEBF40B|nr:flavin reductase family protein [Streptomyces cavernae]
MTWRVPTALPPLPALPGLAALSGPADTPTAVCPRPSAQEFRDVLAHLPAGVSVITTDGPLGPAGMTASAVCSLSMDPPLVLVCLANRSRTLARLLDHGTFAVNVLRQDQEHIARKFADPDTGGHNRFAAAAHRHEADGALILDDALAWLSCRVEETHPGGDHMIVTGRIRALGHTHSRPLIWYARRFNSLA